MSKLVFKVPKKDVHPTTGYMVHQFQCGRRFSEYYLFHPSLAEKPAINVQPRRNKKNTAWVIDPDGDRDLIVLEGSYMTHGKWATSYNGYYVDEILEPVKQYVLTSMSWRSKGGGLGATLVILAVPHDLDPSTPICIIRRTVSAEEEDIRILLLDGREIENVEL